MVDGPRGSAAPAADVGRYLTFMIGDDTWALPVEEVREVIRPLPTTRVPQSPPSLEGLGNLRGAVLPVTNLRRLLRLDPRSPDDATRIIVIDHEALIGLTVDRLGSLVSVDAHRVKGVAVASDLDDEVTDRVITSEGGDAEVRVLAARRLLAAEFSSLGRTAARKVSRVKEAAAPIAQPETRDTLILIGFEAARQDYALPLTSVQEVLAIPERVSVVPRSGSAALGVVTIRDRLLPLVSLRALLGLPQASEVRGKIVVVSLGDAQVGLVADRMGAILRVDPTKVDPVPAVLNRAGTEAEIEAICRVGEGRLVSVLSPERLFSADVVQRVIGGASPERGSALGETSSSGIEQFVVFRIEDDEFGIPIDAVDEVTRVPDELTRLPKAPAFIEGIVNLRGAAIAVIDQRRRFDLPAIERDPRQRIVVLRIGGTRAGFIVDTVSEILKISPDRILPAPELTADQFRLISRVAKPEGRERMVLLIDPVELLDQTEARLLAGVGGAGAPKKKA